MPNGPVATWSHEDKVKETLVRSKKYFGAAIGEQIDALVSPLNLGIMVGTLLLWAVSHFVGVGEVVDVILLIVGAAMIGPSIVDVVKNLMEFGKCIDANSYADLDRSAKAFADAAVVGGITVVMAILLRKGAKSAEARLPNVARPSWLEVARPKGRIGLPSVGADPYAGKFWSKLAVIGDAARDAGTGKTSWFGDIVYSLKGSATDQEIALLHEKVHAALTPRLGILRPLRAQIRKAGYSRSVFLQYIEEAMAEMYAQVRVNGFKGIIEGLRFPIDNDYVSVAALYDEGSAIGAIFVGAQRFTVALIGGPQTWKPDRRPPEHAAKPAPKRIVLDEIVVQGGYSVTIDRHKSLSAIAEEQYGDMRLWPLIWDLNRVKIGPNPNRVSAGVALTLLPRHSYSPAEVAEAHGRAPTWRNYPL